MGGGLLANGRRNFYCGGGGGVIFLDEVVGEGRIEEAVDVEVLLDKVVVALVVFSSFDARQSSRFLENWR